MKKHNIKYFFYLLKDFYGIITMDFVDFRG